MPQTNIVKCPKCNHPILAAQPQKTKTCPHCGTHVNLKLTKPIASAKNAFEASEILKNLKTQKGFHKA